MAASVGGGLFWGCVSFVGVVGLRCVGCGSEVSSEARFCQNCGAPIAATPSPSCIVYLFGDQFAGLDKPLTPGEKLPCGDVKVQKRELAQEMLRAAFAHLEREGSIGLVLGQKKALIFKSEAVFVTLERRDAAVGGIEGGIVEAVTGDSQRDSLDEVVRRLIGEECIDPWSAVIEQAKKHLLSIGYFAEEERSGLTKLIPGKALTPICERVAQLRVHVPAIQALLRDLATRDPALNSRLGEDVKKGITSCYQTRDIEVDE